MPTNASAKKTPPHKASDFPVGTRKRGNDKRLYAVTTDKSGKKRWKYSPPSTQFRQEKTITAHSAGSRFRKTASSAIDKYTITTSKSTNNGVAFTVRYNDGTTYKDILMHRPREHGDHFWTVFIMSMFSNVSIINTSNAMSVSVNGETLQHRFDGKRVDEKAIAMEPDFVRKMDTVQMRILKMFLDDPTKPNVAFKARSKLPDYATLKKVHTDAEKMVERYIATRGSPLNTHAGKSVVETVHRKFT